MKAKKFFTIRRLIAIGVISLAGLSVVGVAIKSFMGAKATTIEAEGEEGGASLNDLVEIDPLYEQYLEDIENGDVEKWNIIPNKYRAKSQATSYNAMNALVGNAMATLPTEYSLTDEYTMKNKNQGLNGDCWAYATTTVMESFLKKNEDIDYEFSPKQLDYLYTSGSPYYDYLTTKSEFSTKALGYGGSFAAATLLMGKNAPISSAEFFAIMKANDAKLSPFASWDDYNRIAYLSGALSSYPGLVVFDDAGSADASGVYSKALPSDELLSEKSDYIVTGYRGFNGSTDNTEKIKESILSNGAVYASMWWPEDINTSTACWDAEHKTVIENDEATCEAVSNGGHAMTIVGWDDNYVYNGGTGAFKMQNSWGGEGEYDYDELVAQGILNVSVLSESEQAALKYILTNWDANETIWLAYDYDVTKSEKLSFGIIDEMKENDYGNIYDMTDEKSVTVLSAKKVKYDFTTDDDEEEYIKEIGLATVLMPADDVEVVAFMKKNDGSDEYEEVGRVPLNKNEYGRSQVVLSEPRMVKGDFDIVIAIANTAGELLNGVNNFAYDIYPSVYMAKQDVEVPGTGGETEEPGNNDEDDGDDGDDEGPDIDVPATGVPEGTEEPKDESKEEVEGDDELVVAGDGTVSKSPETGRFTGGEAGMKLTEGLLLVMVLAGTAGFGICIYRERKHAAHKIDFEKKW